MLARLTVSGYLLACLMLSAPVCAAAQSARADFPSRALRFVVPFAPGGSNDIMARIIGARMAESFGQPVIIDNRPGVGGLLGAGIVAKAPPDGYNLMIHSVSFTTNVAIQTKLEFDPVRDLAPVSQLGAGTLVMVVPAASPAKSMQDLIALARSKPGSLNYGTAGVGTVGHLGTEVWNRMAKIETVHVPFKGLAPAIVALLGGQLQLVLSDVPTALPHLKSGKLRALGVSSDRRWPFLPDVPTVAEAGVAGYTVRFWWGIWAPGGTPRPIVERLNREVAKVLQSPEMRERLDLEGAIPVTSTPDEFAKLVRSEIEFWRKVARDAGIKPE